MNKTKTILLIISVLIVFTLIAILVVQKLSKEEIVAINNNENVNQNQNQNNNINKELEMINLSDTSNWETYTNDEAGFSFKYPKDLDILNYGLSSYKLNNMALQIKVSDINLITDDDPFWYYDKQSTLEDISFLQKGEFGLKVPYSLAGSNHVLMIGNLYAKSFVFLNRMEECDIAFEKQIIFYHNNYAIFVTLAGPGEQIISQFPQYFYKDGACGWNNDSSSINDFYKNVLNGKDDNNIAKNWYNTFDKIINTIEIK